MKRYVEVKVRAVVEIDSPEELNEAIEDIVQFADWEVESWGYEDFGEVEE